MNNILVSSIRRETYIGSQDIRSWWDIHTIEPESACDVGAICTFSKIDLPPRSGECTAYRLDTGIVYAAINLHAYDGPHRCGRACGYGGRRRRRRRIRLEQQELNSIGLDKEGESAGPLALFVVDRIAVCGIGDLDLTLAARCLVVFTDVDPTRTDSGILTTTWIAQQITREFLVVQLDLRSLDTVRYDAVQRALCRTPASMDLA